MAISAANGPSVLAPAGRQAGDRDAELDSKPPPHAGRWHIVRRGMTSEENIKVVSLVRTFCLLRRALIEGTWMP